MNLSGAWYNPGMNGTGFVIVDFEASLILYWYNFSGGFSTLKDGQMWFLCAPHPDSRTDFHIYRPEGRWNGQEFLLGDPIGQLSLDPVDDKLKVAYMFTNLATCKPVMASPVFSDCAGEFFIERITPAI